MPDALWLGGLSGEQPTDGEVRGKEDAGTSAGRSEECRNDRAAGFFIGSTNTLRLFDSNKPPQTVWSMCAVT